MSSLTIFIVAFTYSLVSSSWSISISFCLISSGLLDTYSSCSSGKVCSLEGNFLVVLTRFFGIQMPPTYSISSVQVISNLDTRIPCVKFSSDLSISSFKCFNMWSSNSFKFSRSRIISRERNTRREKSSANSPVFHCELCSSWPEDVGHCVYGPLDRPSSFVHYNHIILQHNPLMII